MRLVLRQTQGCCSSTTAQFPSAGGGARASAFPPRQCRQKTLRQAVHGSGLTGQQLHGGRSNGLRWQCSRWLDNSAQVDVAAPVDRCFRMWEDRESIPTWMPWITSVKVQQDDPRISKWALSTRQFNRDWSFAWLAQNLTPVRNQKIHWRSVPGVKGTPYVANRGAIRFYQKSEGSCSVKLTISYEVPDILAPFAGALTPVVENILATDMRRFASLASKGEPQAVASR